MTREYCDINLFLQGAFNRQLTLVTAGMRTVAARAGSGICLEFSATSLDGERHVCSVYCGALALPEEKKFAASIWSKVLRLALDNNADTVVSLDPAETAGIL